MAAQDGSPAEETASSLSSAPQDETLIASLKGNERATEQAGKEDLEEKQADSREQRVDEGLSGNAMDGEVEREAACPVADAGAHRELSRDSSNGEHGYTAPEGEVADPFKHDSHPAVPTAQSEFSSEQLDGSSNLDGPVFADPPVHAPIPVPASLQTTSAINRTSSPAYSQSSVTSGQGKDPSNVSTAPKKFSTVNINKKFLGKTGSGASPAQGSNTGASGNKDGGGLGLVNLSARPSSLTQQQSSSRILTSVKLTSVIPSKVSSATGGLTAAPAVGWAKSTLAPSAKGTPSGIGGAVSPRTVTPVNAALASTVDASLPSASTIRPVASATSTLPGSPHPPSPSVTPSVMPLAGIRLTNQGPSAARHLTSLTSAKQPIKRGWQTLSSSPASSHDAGTKEPNSIGHGPFGQARFKQSLANDFPTAMEVIAGQKSAVVQAQQVAQAKAAHNQAILEGLNAFRGTNKDPNAHHWDEEDDEDMEFPQALDFGDGTTYTLPVLTNNRESDPLPATRNDLSGVEETQQSENKPVFKHERFAKDDFDRSWPPKAQYGILPQEKARISEQHPNNDHGASTRTLYNARSNKMEPSFDRLVHPSTEMAPTQILPRSEREAQAGANAHMQEKQADMQTLERQTSRDRPWGRVQPPVTAADRNPWARRRPSETDHSRTWGPPHAVSDHQAWPRGHEAAKPRQMDDESRATGGRIRSPVGLQSQLPPLFSQSHVTPAAIPNPVAPAEMITEPIDITELQKDEMHRAAEQARLRRQQEEAEREAQKERARQKAKELAERELLKGTSRVLPSGGLSTAMAKPTLHQKDDPPHMAKVIVKRTEPVPEIPQNSIARPTPSLLSGQRRSSDKRVAFEEPVSQDTQRSPESIQRDSNSEFRTSQQTASTAYIIQREPKNARSSNLSPVSEPSRGFSAFFDPLAESAHVATPAVIHFDDLPSFSLHGKNTTPSDMAKLALGTNARFNLRPELLQAESWRKSTRGQEVVVPGVIGSARESGATPRVLVSRPAVQTVPDTLQTTEDLPHSPPTEVRVALPKPEPQSSRMPGSASDFPSLNANVGSAFDTVLARLQSAMTSSGDGGHSQTDFGPGTEIEPDHLAAPLSTVDEIENAPRPLFLVLPRPNDFVFSMLALPPSPGPAWKRYTIRLPRSANSNKPLSTSRLVHRMRNEVPRGWTLSWDPPLELGSRNLSRDDWLTPKTYHRGKPVIIVKTPSQKFQPYVPPQEDTRPGESSSVTSQALKEEGTRSGARKIIVKLPTGKARSSAVSSDESGTAEIEFVREEFQTSSEIPLLSPSSSSEHLPSTAQNTATTAEHKAATRSKATRRVPEGVAIAFARPHGESFSEDAEAKSSVRFMVSSEIEDDNLLSEVNKMSMDGLTDNPAAEDLHVRAQETEPRTPSTPSAHPRSASGTKSGPPSPNVTANTAWTSTATYSGAQSPGRKLPSREHLMNVWSHLDGDRGATQPSTVFRPLENDVATALSSSVQDLNEAPTSSEMRSERNEPEIDLDLPRYPSIHGAPPASDVDDHLKETNGQNYSNAGIDTAGEYQAGNSVSNGYDGYQYATLSSHMAHPPSNMPSPYSTRSPIDGMPNNIHSTNPLNGMSAIAPQHGVWMPLQQASNMAYSPGLNSHGASTYGAHGMSKSPVSSGYDGTPIISNAGINLGQMPASTGGMYSHPSGPLDSPTAPYIRPSGYTSQPSHLSGMPNLYSQGGSYANNGRDMYGMNVQYGPRGGMNQPMLPAGNREYSGRFNNSNTNSNRPFGGFNGGTTNSLGGSRYNAGVNGFGQPIAHGSQQQHRAGLAGQGKVAANPGRKVW